ncbi:MAG: hypothetical protein GY820_05980 [Gammaproteobacteria bacterium]|nr:hypothetical protein [Gammaproteobacteria bacterium]
MIIDLSPLNERIQYNHFKMESLKDALDLLEEKAYITKVGLKNAYYSIPIAEDYQPYLAFIWKGKVTRLCFGLARAPRIFTKVMKPILVKMRLQGANIVAYIDDFWICHRNRDRCRELTFLLIINHLESLGFVINRENSLIDPVQKLTFLGMEICSVWMTVSLPDNKRENLLSQIQQMLKNAGASSHEIMGLIGQLEEIRPAFSLVPLYYRRIQHWLLTRLKGTSTPSFVTQPLGQSQLDELQLWIVE